MTSKLRNRMAKRTIKPVDPDSADIEDSTQTFVSHLVELRDRLIRSIIAVLLVFLGLAYFANQIYAFLAGPLLQHMPSGIQMIATEVASPFLAPFKLNLVVSVFLAIPYVLYQAWAFFAPGLYTHERRLIFPLLLASILLFYAGIAFAYFVVFPLMFAFFSAAAPPGVTVMTDITHYLDFILTIFFAFGVAFEVPVATILLVWSGVVTPAGLREKRPYIIVLAFVIGMVLTPPDVVSQTLLSVPIWMLFELGLLFSRFFEQDRRESEAVSPEKSSDA